MGGGHHHHSERLPIPDYRIYQVGEHTPELLKIERMLAAKGLKDPWMRNEVWRYDTRMHGTYMGRAFQSLGLAGRGFVGGLVLALISTAVTKYRQSKNPHHHGHGDHH